MKGFGQSTNNGTQRLAEAQERAHAARTTPPAALTTERADSLPTLFRIHTEDLPGFVPLVSKYFTGATLSPVTGIWKGHVEAAMVIELVQPYYERQNVMALAGDILRKNKQEAVMVTVQNTRGFDSVMVNA